MGGRVGLGVEAVRRSLFQALHFQPGVHWAASQLWSPGLKFDSSKVANLLKQHFMQLLTLSDIGSDCLWKVYLSDSFSDVAPHIFNRCPRSHLNRKNSAATCGVGGFHDLLVARSNGHPSLPFRLTQASDKHVSSLHFRIYRDDQQRFFVEARFSWSVWYSMNLTKRFQPSEC